MAFPNLVIQEPPLAPPLHGFLTAAFPVDPSVQEGDRWMDGFTFRPLPEPAMGLWDPASTGAGRTKTNPAAPVPPVDVSTFVAEAPYRESTWGLDWAEVRRRGRTALDVALSWRIEQELWAGADGVIGAASLTQAGATVIADTPVSPGVGLALLTEALGDSYGGVLGMIHAPAAVGSMWMSGTAEGVSLSGRRLASKARGDVVVIGSGYDGTTGPAGDVNASTTGTIRWVFASPMFSYRLGEVEVIPDAQDQALTKRTNTLDLRAEQVVGLYTASPLADRLFALRIDLAL